MYNYNDFYIRLYNMYYCNYIIIYNHYFMSKVFPKLYDFIIHIFLVELILTFSTISIHFMIFMGLSYKFNLY